MPNDHRPRIHFPYLYMLLSPMAHHPSNPMDLELSVEGEGHARVALSIAHGYASLLGRGVVRTRENISTTGCVMYWLPSIRIEPDECVRVYAPGAAHTRLILHLPLVDPGLSYACALGSRTDTAIAVRDLVLAAGGRMRELELLCFESFDDADALSAYDELYDGQMWHYPPERYHGQVLLHPRKDNQPALAILQDYWRKPGILDRILSTDAANQSLTQTETIYELHTDLPALEHLIMRQVIMASATAGNRRRLRVNTNPIVGACSAHDFGNAVVCLANTGWLEGAVQRPIGWEVSRGPRLRGMTRDDLVGL